MHDCPVMSVVANVSRSGRRDAVLRAPDGHAALPRGEADDLLRWTAGLRRLSVHVSEHFHY
jgi:hypothetical protein